MKLLHFTSLVLLLIIVLTASYIEQTSATFVVSSAFCSGKCKVRCSKASVKDRCLKYCGICCAKCNCVPSGTYGNKDECPCYRDMVTGGAKKKPKCP